MSIDPPSHSSKTATLPDPTIGRPAEILLVEDSQTDALLAMEALSQAKVINNLHVVKDGVAAIEFLNRSETDPGPPRPDLILLDLNLPRKDGREVLAEIKASPTLKQIPVVVLTTSSAEKDVLESYGHHANCYITKPIDFGQFVEVVRQVESFWFAVVTLPPKRIDTAAAESK